MLPSLCCARSIFSCPQDDLATLLLAQHQVHLDEKLLLCEESGDLERCLCDVAVACRTQTIAHDRVYGKECIVSLRAVATGISIASGCSGDVLKLFPFCGSCSADELLRACGWPEDAQLMADGAIMPLAEQIEPKDILQLVLVFGKPEVQPPPDVLWAAELKAMRLRPQRLPAAILALRRDMSALVEVFYRQAGWAATMAFRVESLCCSTDDLLLPGQRIDDLTIGSLLTLRPQADFDAYVYQLIWAYHALTKPLVEYPFLAMGERRVHIIVETDWWRTRIYRKTWQMGDM